MKAKVKPSLTFSNIYSMTGLLNDGKGNEFRIYVSGRKEDVNEFIRYQKRKLKQGILGINVTVTSLKSVKQEAAVTVKTRRPRKDSEIGLKSGKVKIGISRIRIADQPPYKIAYHIDPPIKLSQNQAIAALVPAFELEFDGPIADVSCRVNSGSVKFSLTEVGFGEAMPSLILNSGQSGTLQASSKGNLQKWQITATGLSFGKPSEFDLTYTKTIF